jgi:hypothetical protein
MWSNDAMRVCDILGMTFVAHSHIERILGNVFNVLLLYPAENLEHIVCQFFRVFADTLVIILG